MGVQEAKVVLLYLLMETLTYLKLFFLVVSQWVQATPLQLPKDQGEREMVHAIVAVGDDHILGMGDYTTLVSPCGSSERLQVALGKEPTVRQRWVVVNRARFGSSTAAWLPPPRGRKDSSLFYQTFIAWKDLRSCCEFVILSLGSNDHSHGITAEKSFENLEKTSEELLGMSYHVFLCTVPLFGRSPEVQEHLTALNSRIRSYCAVRKHNRLHLGLELEKAYFTNGCKGFRGQFFSSRGHVRIADSLLQLLLNPIRAKEYAVWKNKL